MKGRVWRRPKPDGTFYDTWNVVIDAGVDPETGKRKQLTKSNCFKSEKEAWRWIRSTLSEMDRGEYVPPNSILLGDYLREWLPGVRSQVKASTHLGYSSLVNRQIIPRLGKVAVQDLKPTHLRKLYADLAEEGSRKDGRPGGLSSRTIRYVHTLLCLALRDAVTDGLVQRNVAQLVRPPKLRQEEMRCWDGQEAQRFLAHARSDRLWAAWALALCTGMRQSEILGLRWTDVDLENGRLTAQQTLTSIGYKPTFETPKSDFGCRTLDLNPQTVRILREHRRSQAEEKLAWGPSYVDSGLVFTRENGELVHPNALARRFSFLIKESGVSKIGFHGLRHTSASLALQAGVNILVVSKRLGHASVSFTLDTYGHLMPGQQAEAAARLASILYASP